MIGKIAFFLIVWSFLAWNIDQLSLRTIFPISYSSYTLLLLIALSFLQWTLEAFKTIWFYGYFELKVSLALVLKGVFRGATLAFLLPNKLGQVGGRLSILQPKQVPTGLKSYFYSVVLQSASTLTLALLGISLLYTHAFVFYILIGLIIMAIIILRKWATPLLINLSRNIIIVLQYCILLSELGWEKVAASISYMLGILTFVPGLFLGDIGSREALLILLLQDGSNTATLIQAGITIWIVNLLIPAIIGAACWSFGYKPSLKEIKGVIQTHYQTVKSKYSPIQIWKERKVGN